MAVLIGVHGKARAGKDTIHSRIVEMYSDKTVERRAFADPLKNSVCALFDISRAALEGYKVDKSATVSIQTSSALPDIVLTMRDFLQNYGTEAHRGIFGTDFWLDETLPPYESLIEADVFVFTDVRFPNEAERIREHGGTIWHVIGKNDNNDDEHASEAVLSPELIDFTIDNSNHDDEFQNLDTQIKNIMEQQVVLK